MYFDLFTIHWHYIRLCFFQMCDFIPNIQHMGFYPGCGCSRGCGSTLPGPQRPQWPIGRPEENDHGGIFHIYVSLQMFTGGQGLDVFMHTSRGSTNHNKPPSLTGFNTDQMHRYHEPIRRSWWLSFVPQGHQGKEVLTHESYEQLCKQQVLNPG